MAHIAYVNGQYLPHSEAAVHIDDRGYQFADGIYEYFAFYNRCILDEGLHLKRMERSLKELGIAPPVSLKALPIIMRELIARNGRTHGGLYMQISRGVARRDHPFPKECKASLVITICAAKFPKPHEVEEGVSVITHPDLRWARCDIKSLALLPNVLAKQEASKQKVREAWLLRGDMVTEGAVSNAYLITMKGEIMTHPADEHILGGITREQVLKLARKAKIPVIERGFTLKDIGSAAEAFLTSTSANILPVVKVDGKPLGTGKPGDITRKLQSLYVAHIEKETGWKWSV